MFPCLPHSQHYDQVPSYYDYIEHPFGGWAVRHPTASPSRSGCCPANASQVPNGKQFWDGAGDVEVCGFTGGDNLDWLVLLLTQLRIKSYSPHPKSQGLECRPILVKHCLRAEQDSDINADGTAVLHHCEACAAPNVAV